MHVIIETIVLNNNSNFSLHNSTPSCFKIPKKNYERYSKRAANKHLSSFFRLACSLFSSGWIEAWWRTNKPLPTSARVAIQSLVPPLSDDRACCEFALKSRRSAQLLRHSTLLNFETHNKSGLPTFDTLPAAGAHASDGHLRLFKPTAAAIHATRRNKMFKFRWKSNAEDQIYFFYFLNEIINLIFPDSLSFPFDKYFILDQYDY